MDDLFSSVACFFGEKEMKRDHDCGWSSCGDCGMLLTFCIRIIFVNLFAWQYKFIFGQRCSFPSFWVYWRARSASRSEKRNHWKISENMLKNSKYVVFGAKKRSKSDSGFIEIFFRSFRSYRYPLWVFVYIEKSKLMF